MDLNSVISFVDCVNVGDVFEIFNSFFFVVDVFIVFFFEFCIKFIVVFDVKKMVYKLFVMKLFEVSEVFDDWIDDFMNLV